MLEAEILEQLDHAAIVRHVAHGSLEDGAPYLVMEWIDGPTLEGRLEGRPLRVQDALLLTRRLAEALSIAHAAGVVHRDVKPANVMLPGGELAAAKLVDFGVARADGSSSLTQTGVRVGTPRYMAPEQIRSAREVDARADLFSLGCVLFETLAGLPAFPADNAMAVMVQILFEPAPRLADLRADLADPIVSLVQRLLAREREVRPSSALAVVRELDALLGHLADGTMVAPRSSLPDPALARLVVRALPRPDGPLIGRVAELGRRRHAVRAPRPRRGEPLHRAHHLSRARRRATGPRARRGARRCPGPRRRARPPAPQGPPHRRRSHDGGHGRLVVRPALGGRTARRRALRLLQGGILARGGRGGARGAPRAARSAPGAAPQVAAHPPRDRRRTPPRDARRRPRPLRRQARRRGAHRDPRPPPPLLRRALGTTARLAHEKTGSAAALQRLARELDDLHAAVEHALEHDDGDDACALAAAIEPVLSSRGAAAAALTLLERALAIASTSSPAVQAAMQARARTLGALGRAEEGLADLRGLLASGADPGPLHSSSACCSTCTARSPRPRRPIRPRRSCSRRAATSAARPARSPTSAPSGTTRARSPRPSRSTARPSPSSPRSAICACAGSPWATSRSPSRSGTRSTRPARASPRQSPTSRPTRTCGCSASCSATRASASSRPAGPSPAPTSSAHRRCSPPPETAAPSASRSVGSPRPSRSRGGSATPTPGSRAPTACSPSTTSSRARRSRRSARRATCCAQRRRSPGAAPQTPSPSSASPPGASRRPRPASRAAPSVGAPTTSAPRSAWSRRGSRRSPVAFTTLREPRHEGS
ncbi:MAG: protein kinase [Myxococcales bacterium]|nr:protein kinase [Myxococcales bacterium]